MSSPYWLMAGILLINLFTILLITKYYKKKIDYQLNHMLAKQINRHLEEVKSIYDTMRGWRHDYHNHIQTLKGYVSLNRYEEANIYLSELDEDLTGVDHLVKSGNIVIDVILNSKITLAISREIDVTVDVFAPEKLTVSDIDLCVILGNLMDNAIDACMEIENWENRFLRIYMGKLKNQYYISLTNSTARSERVDKYRTNKNNLTHGHGLKRIDRASEKYGAFVNRQNEPGVFATEILLPL